MKYLEDFVNMFCILFTLVVSLGVILGYIDIIYLT